MSEHTVIKVIGLGGGGSNAVNRMIQLRFDDVQFIAANTDAQALATSEAPTKILLGPRSARGLGAGGAPERGERAADESAAELAAVLQGADVVFIAAGMGGGTGTGAVPIAARIARETGALVIGVVTMPFSFEGPKRALNARGGIQKLRKFCHTLVAVPNDKLLGILPHNVSLDIAFRVADEVLRQGIQGMAELVTRSGLINVDFANVRQLMQIPGGAFLAIGQGKGDNKVADAVRESLNHRLVESDTLRDACGVLVHFTGGDDMGLHEIGDAMALVGQSVRPNAQIVMGASVDQSLSGRAQVILVATGIGSQMLDEVEKPARRTADVAPRVESVSQRQPVAVAQPEPEAPLAGRLFAAVQQQTAQSVEWVLPSEPKAAIDPNDLDVPAFLRKRRLFAAR